MDASGHDRLMGQCFELAEIARQQGESPVGSLLVKDGQVISTGIEGGRARLDITFHAEIEAIRKATTLLKSQDLSGHTLYTTHEPCIMCSYVIRHTRISTVVMATVSDEIGGASSRYPLLKDDTISRWGSPPELILWPMDQIPH